jgi:hypothetical protein
MPAFDIYLWNLGLSDTRHKLIAESPTSIRIAGKIGRIVALGLA